MASRKRSATQNAEASTSTKKTRFAEPDDDPANFSEQVDAALEQPSRKGKVKNEGYDSDSTDDGEGVVESRKKKGQDEDGEDDMFALGDKEEDDESNAKKEQFMRLGDIEGQEFGVHSGSEDDSERDDEPEDEDDAERKKKAGMGYELSSFNMREEMEEGKFTEDGTYVRSFDPHGVHDRWMEGLGDREIKLARRRKREQEKKQKEKQAAEERELNESGGKNNMEKELLSLLKKGESVLEALQRVGAKLKKTSTNKRSKSRPDANNMEVDKPQPTMSDVEHITHLASSLMSLGDTDIYSKTYEEIVRSVRASGGVDAGWEPPSADIKYEYKWVSPSVGQTDGTFGPFGEEDLKSWYNASYFGGAGEKIQVRTVGGEWGSWQDIVQ